jgi:hypothetical protein
MDNALGKFLLLMLFLSSKRQQRLAMVVSFIFVTKKRNLHLHEHINSQREQIHLTMPVLFLDASES